MASSQRGLRPSGESKSEAKKRLVQRWRSAINDDDGSFDSTFGDPETTPYAIRLLVYYNDEGGVESKISIPGVENGKWKKEDSYNDNEMALLLSLIEEALPLLERQVYEFAFAVYEALESFDSDPSLTDPELAQFMSLEQPQSTTSKPEPQIARATIASTASTAPATSLAPLEFNLGPSNTLIIESYLQQTKRWPGHGQHILGTFTDTAILVYQAFNNEIADYAIREQKFTDAPGYSTSRMTWFKPNFLWMMYRSKWGKSSNQQRILGIWLKLEAFHEMLAHATHTSTSAAAEEWNSSPTDSSSGWKGRVNLQWDPDHGPTGKSLFRRAIQIGVKNVPSWHTGENFERIIDLTPLVKEQRKFVPSQLSQLFTPQERLYFIPNKSIAKYVKVETTVSDLAEEKSLLAVYRRVSPQENSE